MVSSWGRSEKIVIYVMLCSFRYYFEESKQNMIALLPCFLKKLTPWKETPVTHWFLSGIQLLAKTQFLPVKIQCY